MSERHEDLGEFQFGLCLVEDEVGETREPHGAVSPALGCFSVAVCQRKPGADTMGYRVVDDVLIGTQTVRKLNGSTRRLGAAQDLIDVGQGCLNRRSIRMLSLGRKSRVDALERQLGSPQVS